MRPFLFSIKATVTLFFLHKWFYYIAKTLQRVLFPSLKPATGIEPRATTDYSMVGPDDP